MTAIIPPGDGAPPALPGKYRAWMGEDGILNLAVIEVTGPEST